jgi:hypothetical protein
MPKTKTTKPKRTRRGGAVTGGRLVKGRPDLMTPFQHMWRDVVTDYYNTHKCTFKQALIACKGRGW